MCPTPKMAMRKAAGQQAPDALFHWLAFFCQDLEREACDRISDADVAVRGALTQCRGATSPGTPGREMACLMTSEQVSWERNGDDGESSDLRAGSSVTRREVAFDLAGHKCCLACILHTRTTKLGLRATMEELYSMKPCCPLSFRCKF